MYANQKLLENLDVEKVLKYYNFHEDTNCSGDIIRTNCMIHGGDNTSAFAINRETGLWFCHTGDCKGGDIFNLIEKLEDVDFKTSVNILSNILDVNVEGLKTQRIKTKNEKEMETFIKAIKSTSVVDFKPFEFNTPTTCIAKYRNFLKSTIEDFRMSFAREVDLERSDGSNYKLFDRLIFPIMKNNVMIGASIRRTKNADFPKWSHQPKGIKTSEILYNIDNVLNCEEIVVVEGILDVWAFHELEIPSVCVFGSSISKKQYAQLLKLGANLIFAFDGDEAGRKATKDAIELFRYKANMSVINFDEGEDPENITREELMLKYERKTRIQ